MIQKEQLLKEFSHKAVRSGGSGGQNVNKVATCVQLFFDVEKSVILNEEQKIKVKKYLKNRINNQGVLMMDCSESRSQARNKQLVNEKCFNLIIDSFKEKKKRLKTHMPNSVKERRYQEKKQKSEIKAGRSFRI